MPKEWLWWAAEFGLAVVIAVVSSFITKDVPISILYGLFVGTVFFVIRQQSSIVSRFEQQVSEMEDKALNLPTTLKNREDIDPFLKQLVRSSREETLRLSKEVEKGEVTLKPSPIALIALNCIKLARPGDKVVALNYGNIWESDRGDVYRQASLDLAAKGVDITRVFVERTPATPEQKELLKEEMDRQKRLLKVRFVKESRLPPEARTNFVIILNRYAFYGYFKRPGDGQSLEIDELKIFTRREEVEKATEMAEIVVKLSEEYN